jgi:hypothetical protein
MKLRRSLLAGSLALAAASTMLTFAQDTPKPADKAKPKYKAGDMTRPRPVVVDPGTASTADVPGKPPSDAIILFDGKDLSAWQTAGKAKPDNPDRIAKWKVENGFMEIAPRVGGAIETKEKFGDSQVHIEWATPKEVKGSSQGRGNSGIYLGSFGEVQVLDSFENDTYPDGQAGALYSKLPPLVNASRKPGEWQVYDIIAHFAKVEDGKVVRPAIITVLHNGVVVHHAVDFGNRTGTFSLLLQDHGNPVRYRNIWVRKLKDYDVDGTPPPVKKENPK